MDQNDPTPETSPTALTPSEGLPLSRFMVDPDLLRDHLEALADNTLKGYGSDLADYSRWLGRTRSHQWDDPKLIASYFRALANADAAYATIERRKAAISKLAEIETADGHRDPYQNPARHPRVLIALKALRNQLPAQQTEARPLTGERLVQVLSAMTTQTLKNQRDTAMLLTGFYGALRVSELVRLTPNDIKFTPQGMIVSITPSRSNQKTVHIAIHAHPRSDWDPVGHLQSWINTLNTTDLQPNLGLWRRLTKADRPWSPQTAITPKTIERIITERVLKANLSHPHQYTTHSLRAGFITTAQNLGINEASIMNHTRHRTLTAIRRYNPTTELWHQSPTAQLTL